MLFEVTMWAIETILEYKVMLSNKIKNQHSKRAQGSRTCFWKIVVIVWSLSCVQLLKTPWTVAPEAPLSMGFPRQEYRSGLPCPSPGDLPDPGTEPVSPALAGTFFTTEPVGKPKPVSHIWFSGELHSNKSLLCLKSSMYVKLRG